MMSGLKGWFRTLTSWQLVPLVLLTVPLLFAEWVPAVLVALALLGLPVLWLFSRLACGAFVPATPLDLPWLAVLFASLGSLLTTTVPELALPQVCKILIALALYYGVVNTLGSERRLAWTGIALLVAALAIACVGVAGLGAGGSTLASPSGGLGLRLSSLITPFWNRSGFNPNIVGGTLAVMLPLTLAYAWGSRGWRRLPLIAALLAEGGALALTHSRGAILGFGAGVACVAVARDRRWGLVLLGVMAAGAAGLLLYPGPALDLVTAGGGGIVDSAQGRLELWSRALAMMADFPFSGVGMGSFSRTLWLLYPLASVGPDSVLDHAHNLFLQAGTDYGLPGLVAWLAQMALLLWMGLGAVRRARGGSLWPLAAGLLGGLVAYLVHGLTDSFTYYAKGHTVVWGCLSVIAALWLVLGSRAQDSAGVVGAEACAPS
jgi:putative inorganic carbon (HCO3(-)) transporter